MKGDRPKWRQVGTCQPTDVEVLHALAVGSVRAFYVNNLLLRLRKTGPEKWELHGRGGITTERLAGYKSAPCELRA